MKKKLAIASMAIVLLGTIVTGGVGFEPNVGKCPPAVCDAV